MNAINAFIDCEVLDIYLNNIWAIIELAIRCSLQTQT